MVEILRRFLQEYDMPRRASACYQCGACAGGCPVNRWRREFNPRLLIQMILRDRLEMVVKDGAIWLCANCLTCLERCPQRLEVAEIMVQIKNVAARLGNVPASEARKGAQVMALGWAEVPGRRILKTREALGLPDLDPGITSVELETLGRSLDWPAKMATIRNRETMPVDEEGRVE